MMLPATSLYRVNNIEFGAELIYTNNTYCQAMRGYGNPELTWALESNLDELAEQAGIDPLEMRRINCNEPGETTPMGLKYTTCGLRECLESTGKKLDWKQHKDSEPSLGNRSRGVGLASLMHVGGSGRIYRSDGGGIILRLDDYGNTYVYCGGVEMGQGLHAALTSIVAEAVGVSPEKVFINPTDTATCPWDVGTHASRGAFIAGNAAILAAQKLRKQIFSLAGEVLPAVLRKNLQQHTQRHPGYQPPDVDIEAACRVDRLELQDGHIVLRDVPDEPWTRVELGRLLRAIHFRDGGRMLTVEAFYEPPTRLPDWNKGIGDLSANYAFGTQGVEVEVDRDTGEVKILRMVAVHDVGKVLNPQTLAGQIYGALAQGIGYALYEQVKTERGRILNPNFTDYKIPTAHEMNFPIELEFIETNDKSGPYGAKGVGEPGLVPTAPALANAIYDAVGVRIRDLPITPEKLLAAMKRGRSPRNGPKRDRRIS
jgi:CO/xanthine dehydrogenase Mo-binding subunit